MDVDIKGIRYHVDVCGEGFPCLLLHGFTGDASTWAPFFDDWGKHAKLIVPDIIGHGRTDSPEGVEHYQIEAAAHDLVGILDFLGFYQVDLLGYSMGGRLALTFALLFPNRVRKLILESSSPGLKSDYERGHRRKKDAELATFIKEQGIKSFVDYWEDIPLFKTMRQLPASIQNRIRAQRLKNSTQGLANSLIGMGTGSQPSWWNHLNQLNCDVLLLTGSKDQKFCSIAESMLNILKKGTWISIENTGHAVHVEYPEKFGTIVSGFLLNA